MHNPPTKKLAYSVKDALAVTSVSRSLLYEEMAAGRLKSFHIGRRRLISAEALADWLQQHQAAQPQSSQI
jgi:excisionase family DNA binding protein